MRLRGIFFDFFGIAFDDLQVDGVQCRRVPMHVLVVVLVVLTASNSSLLPRTGVW